MAPPLHARDSLWTRQEEESRYRHYNKLVDKDLAAATGGKPAAKQHLDDEKMVLDLDRVGTKRKQVRPRIQLVADTMLLQERTLNEPSRTFFVCEEEENTFLT